ncbi:TRAP transporter large permease subunit [Bacillus mangrovi]|uniref:TRAP transporter large permease subunit n=1 Tax=Metabacillus mangrovi TaxID=1491830 RepID=A0A7X2S5E2_9BACI|nr:Na+/H+ antiporter family protein [Metabacillus mangrovi]MTH53840.1 TRAP transporter large permease subunit [Metabacillus mangrovi]
MNAVILAVVVLLLLSLFRVNVVFSLIIGALAGGFASGLDIKTIGEAFTAGLGGNAAVALSYASLGAFAVALTKTGLPDAMVQLAIKLVGREGETNRKTLSKVMILFIILLVSISSQNLVPVHIAFIPVLIPPLLKIFNQLEIDRRLVAAVITFGLITPYMYVQAGFGAIFHGILRDNMKQAGLSIKLTDIPQAMMIPSLGMAVGLVIAFILYRKKRQYEAKDIAGVETAVYSRRTLAFAGAAIVVSLGVQLYLSKMEIDGGMIFGALAGIAVLYVTGAMKWKEADQVLTKGMQMMAFIGFVMLAAAGFASVMKETGHIETMVKSASGMIGSNQSLAALLMLIVGLLVTMGIGSSFSTIPIITALFVPLCLNLGFSPLATIAIIGTAGALGDAGSPVSDSTLGPTSGLNADGQHDHIWDTVVPTFVLYNIPLILFGWIAAMVL